MKEAIIFDMTEDEPKLTPWFVEEVRRELERGKITLPPMGCICPGDATAHCANPLCPRKSPYSMHFGFQTPRGTTAG